MPSRSGSYPSPIRTLAAPAATLAGTVPGVAKVRQPLPRDVNREDTERVRELFSVAVEWWLREHESSIRRLAELMRMSHCYLLEVLGHDQKPPTRPVQPWMFARMPYDLWHRFSDLMAHNASTRRVANAE